MSKRRTRADILKEKAQKLAEMDPIAHHIKQGSKEVKEVKAKKGSAASGPNILARNEMQHIGEYRKKAKQAPVELNVDSIRVTELANRDESFLERSAFEQLVTSIQNKGQLIPIIVRETNELVDGHPYELVAGRRRLEACRKLGIKVKAFVVEDIDDGKLMELQFLENFREELTTFEQAETIKALLDMGVYSNFREISKSTSISPATISRMLSILKIPEEIRNDWLMRNKRIQDEQEEIVEADVCPISVCLPLSKHEKDLEKHKDQIVSALKENEDAYWSYSWSKRVSIILELLNQLKNGQIQDDQSSDDKTEAAFKKVADKEKQEPVSYSIRSGRKQRAKLQFNPNKAQIKLTVRSAIEHLDEDVAREILEQIDAIVSKYETK